MSELIEKQKVLDALREIATEKFSLDDPYGVYINVLMDVEEKICHLPVVQPNGPDNLVKDIQVLAKDLANDAISRQEAIDIVNKYDKSHMILMGKPMLGATSIVIELEDLPSAQPERKKGKWIYGEDEYGVDGYHCDECGFFVPWDYAHNFINYIEDYNFCPNCGADMRGEQNG